MDKVGDGEAIASVITCKKQRGVRLLEDIFMMPHVAWWDLQLYRLPAQSTTQHRNSHVMVLPSNASKDEILLNPGTFPQNVFMQ